MQNNQLVLACDVGGTHITSALVNTEDWSILQETITRSDVNSQSDAKSIFQDWASSIKQCLERSKSKIHKIGIAMPGPFDYEKGIALMTGQSKYDSIYQMSVTNPILEKIDYPIEEVRYINDAAAFLQGEVYAQNRSDEDKILGITLGTGLGSSVWTNGQKSFDADLWNTPYKESIFEEYLVTRWITKRFHELTGIHEKGLKEIIEQHSTLNEVNILFEEYLQHLAAFLKFFSEKHGSTKYIIGGNITKAWKRINQVNPKLLQDYDIQLGKYHEFAAIIGAASLFS